MKWTHRHGLIAALALVLATNAFVLIGAAYNRSGTPEATLALTQRELWPGYALERHENSGLALGLHWRVLDVNVKDVGHNFWYGGGSPAWLDEKKMAALGFDTSLPEVDIESRRSFQRQLAREVLLVLELDGPAWREMMERTVAESERLKALPQPESVKRASDILEEERNANSRLFAVDAGLDAAALRARYPDRSHYAIVRGQVQPSIENRAGIRTHAGHVNRVSVDVINVPLELRGAFEGAAPRLMGSWNALVKYEAKVAFGQRLEPWIMGAAKK